MSRKDLLYLRCSNFCEKISDKISSNSICSGILFFKNIIYIGKVFLMIHYTGHQIYSYEKYYSKCKTDHLFYI